MMLNKTIISTLLLSWLLVSSCTKHEEFSLPPKLGEKGNGVTVQGTIVDYYSGEKKVAKVKLLNITYPLMSLPRITTVREVMSDSNGVFKFDDVIMIGDKAEIVSTIEIESNEKNSRGFTYQLVYIDFNGKRYDTKPHLDILFGEVFEIFDFKIVIG